MEYGERLTITTPEGVELDLALAGIGSRFIATMLDILIQAAVGIVSVLVVSGVFEGGVQTLVLSIGAFLLFFSILYLRVSKFGREMP